MKRLRVEIDGKESTLALESDVYKLTGALEHAGKASVVKVADGMYSVVLEGRSYTARVEKGAVWIGNRRYTVSIVDLRDRAAASAKQSLAGAVELKALMPGKVVKLLVKEDERIESGQSLIVVEAMKMQNEMKAPKEGVVVKIHVTEGATVTAGERLMVVE